MLSFRTCLPISRNLSLTAIHSPHTHLNLHHLVSLHIRRFQIINNLCKINERVFQQSICPTLESKSLLLPMTTSTPPCIPTIQPVLDSSQRKCMEKASNWSLPASIRVNSPMSLAQNSRSLHPALNAVISGSTRNKSSLPSVLSVLPLEPSIGKPPSESISPVTRISTSENAWTIPINVSRELSYTPAWGLFRRRWTSRRIRSRIWRE